MRQRFDWTTTLLCPSALVGMEAFWVNPWLAWIGGWPAFSSPRPILHLTTVIGILAVAYGVTRGLVARNWPLWRIRMLIVGMGIGVFLIVQHLEYGLGSTALSATNGIRALSVPAWLYLWWRGITLGRRVYHSRDIQNAFLMGLGALLGLIVLRHFSATVDPAPAAGFRNYLHLMAFFFVGRVAMTMQHLTDMRSAMQSGGAAPASVRRWLPIVIGVISGMLALVFAVSAVFSKTVLIAVAQGIASFWDLVATGIYYLVIPVAYLFDRLFWVVRWAIAFFLGDKAPQEINQKLSAFQEVFGTPQANAMPPALVFVVQWGLAILVAAVLIWILARAVARFRTDQMVEEIEEVHESLWSWHGFMDDVGLVLTKMADAVRQMRKRDKGAPTFDPTLRPVSIREIYRRLQWEAAESGVARHSNETAQEYGSRLARWIPAGSEALTPLTQFYGAERYGERQLPHHDLDQANALWETIHSVIQQSAQAATEKNDSEKR